MSRPFSPRKKKKSGGLFGLRRSSSSSNNTKKVLENEELFQGLPDEWKDILSEGAGGDLNLILEAVKAQRRSRIEAEVLDENESPLQSPTAKLTTSNQEIVSPPIPKKKPNLSHDEFLPSVPSEYISVAASEKAPSPTNSQDLLEEPQLKNVEISVQQSQPSSTIPSPPISAKPTLSSSQEIQMTKQTVVTSPPVPRVASPEIPQKPSVVLSPTLPPKLQHPPTKQIIETPTPSYPTNPISTQATPLLPPKPGTQKTTLNNKKPIIPKECPPDYYQALSDLISKEDPRRIYINQVEIGQGSSGTVSLAHDLRTNQSVAIKKMTLAKGVNQLGILRAEMVIMKLSKHKNIVSYVESYIVGNALWCVMEHMTAGDLTQVIRCSRNRLTERSIAIILREILEGINFLHTSLYPILHRDLKSDNILLSLDGSVKLSDFGFGTMLTHENRTRKEILGTSCWMAPEVILGRDYNTKVDIWSLGIIAQELIDGEPHYLSEPIQNVMKLIVTKGRGPFKNPENLSAEIKNFVKQCTIMDPNTRPSAAQLLQHPFLKKHQGHHSELIPIIKATIEANTLKYEID